MAGRPFVAATEERLRDQLTGGQDDDGELPEVAAPPPPVDEWKAVPLSLAALRQRLGRARDLTRRPLDEEEALPTGLASVDALLDGGLARCCLTEVRGAPSSGRFGLVLSLLAATTARGETAALVDLGDQLDPQEAARCGVELPRLLWARPRRAREALAAAEVLLGAQLPLVVVDLGVPPLPGGARDEHAWLRLARAARQHRAALLVATPWRVTGSAAAEVLALDGRRGVWLGSGTAPRLLAGVEARLCREKSRRHPEPASARLGLRCAELLLPVEPPVRESQRERPARREAPPRVVAAVATPPRRRGVPLTTWAAAPPPPPAAPAPATASLRP